MKISVISFSKTGSLLAEKIKTFYKEGQVLVERKPKEGLKMWTKKQFEEKRALVFIGACGIAVRTIAPFVKDKFSDSPVLVLDEKGNFVIPILSGHVGGANALAKELATYLDATAVITTATDLNHKFAVDLFAKANAYEILNKEGIAYVSSKILKEEPVTISFEGVEKEEALPKGLVKGMYPPKEETDIVISSEEEILKKGRLRLRPRPYVLGIGCKKGKAKEELDGWIKSCLLDQKIKTEDIAFLASINRKKEEKGIVDWAEEHRIPYLTFSEEELKRIQGDFHGSSFVEKTVGVDNVCERAAVAGCHGRAELIMEKRSENGMTLAIAKRTGSPDWKGWMEDEA